jgi:hypothetical protein
VDMIIAIYQDESDRPTELYKLPTALHLKVHGHHRVVIMDTGRERVRIAIRIRNPAARSRPLTRDFRRAESERTYTNTCHSKT